MPRQARRPRRIRRARALPLHRQGEIIRCPWHGWEFDLRTGKSRCDPKRTWVKSYPDEREPGGRLAEGPYVAETFEVSVEDDYVIIEA